jgi:uncharacterized protein
MTSLPVRVAMLAALLPVATLPAQSPMTHVAEPVPMIEVHGSAEVKATPDRALVMVSVQNRGRTAALAGQENARRATAIQEAIRATGIAREQLSTADYNVQPQYTYANNRPPELNGYMASNTVRVEVRALENVGRVIDAALGAGATNIGGVSFYVSNLDGVRRDALAAATRNARLAAEAIATAAGGRLGTLVLITTQESAPPMPVPMMMRAAVADAEAKTTPIEAPAEQTISMSVTGRWRFVPNETR